MGATPAPDARRAPGARRSARRVARGRRGAGGGRRLARLGALGSTPPLTELADDYRSLMRGFPSGVAVLTVDVEGERLGLTLGSVVSLSLEPPLVGAAVSRQAAMHELLRNAGGFALSLLAGDQEAVAQHFARGVPPFAHWHGVATRPGAAGAPLLDGALGWLECRTSAEHPAGDHTLFVGEVLAAERGRGASALVYRNQAYVSA